MIKRDAKTSKHYKIKIFRRYHILKKFIKKVMTPTTDELETMIILKSKRNSLLFLRIFLVLWQISEIYRSSTDNSFQGNVLPGILLLMTLLAEQLSQIFLQARYTNGNEEYQADRKKGRKKKILFYTAFTILLLFFLILFCIFSAGALRWGLNK